MTKISSVRLENFQSHLDTFVEFDHGINMLVGQSDSGKTAILRGIRWTLYNQPRGTDFIRVGADFVRVTVSFDNGTVITRERTSSKNRYSLKKPDREELILEGFGIHVPEEITEAHGMGHLRIDQDNELMLHLSQQLDGPFLLEQTSAVRAKTLGRISGAHYLDMAIRDTSKDLSQLNVRMKQEEQAIEKLEQELEPYKELDRMKSKLDQVEYKSQHIQVLNTKKKQLQSLASRLESLNTEEERTKIQLELVGAVDNWEAKLTSLQEMVQHYIKYEKMKNRTQELNRAIDVCQMWIDKTKNIEKAQRDHERLNENISKLRKLKDLSAHVKQIVYNKQTEKGRLKNSEFLGFINHSSIDQITIKQQKLDQLKRIQHLLNQHTKQKEKVVQVSNRLPVILDVTTKQESIVKKSERLETLKKIRAQLNEFEGRMEEGKKFIIRKAEEQERAEEAWHNRLLIEGTCPTCGQEICKH